MKRRIVSSLLRAACLAPGMRVLDMSTGSGLTVVFAGLAGVVA